MGTQTVQVRLEGCLCQHSWASCQDKPDFPAETSGNLLPCTGSVLHCKDKHGLSDPTLSGAHAALKVSLLGLEARLLTMSPACRASPHDALSLPYSFHHDVGDPHHGHVSGDSDWHGLLLAPPAGQAASRRPAPPAGADTCGQCGDDACWGTGLQAGGPGLRESLPVIRGLPACLLDPQTCNQVVWTMRLLDDSQQWCKKLAMLPALETCG